MAAPRLVEQLRAHAAPAMLLAGLLLVAGLAGAWSAYHEEARDTRTVSTTRWSESAAFAYSVPVTRNSTHWPNGTVLPMGMPGYFRTISDRVLVNFTWAPSGADAERGLADASLTLRVRADSPQGRPFWSFERPLAQGLFAAGEPVALHGTVDLDGTAAEVERASREMPVGDGHLNVTVIARVAYAFDRAGQDEAGTSEFALPVGLGDPRVTLPDPGDITWERPHATLSTSTTATTLGWAGVLGSLRSLALVAGGVAALAAIAWAVRAGPARGVDAAEGEFRRELERHREYVTLAEGPLDAARLPAPLVDTATLDDLVEAAADARTRVVLDRASRVYYAVLPTMTYR